MYPKTFFATEKPVPKPGTCFVIMPFEEEFEEMFQAIRQGLEVDLGFTCRRTKELSGGGNIIEDILRGIGESEFVVVDATRGKPNVFYELGIAHVWKNVENVILLTQEIDSVPFDLRDFRHITYSPTRHDTGSLRQRLINAVTSVEEIAHRIIVPESGKGELRKPLMGIDRCLYQFSIPEVYCGSGAAKLRLMVIRQIMRQKLESEDVFNDGMGLEVGESRDIPGTEWSIYLERVGDKPMAIFRIRKKRSLQELVVESTDRQRVAY